MELGATICTPTSPRCLVCPVAKHCVAAIEGRQDQLPVVKKRKRAAELPLIDREQLWIGNDRELVLAKRPTDAGLWGGLWELPEAGSLDVATDEIVAHHEQLLTHRRLRVRVRRAKLPRKLTVPAGYTDVQRVAITDAERMGIALATASIIRKYRDDPW